VDLKWLRKNIRRKFSDNWINNWILHNALIHTWFVKILFPKYNIVIVLHYTPDFALCDFICFSKKELLMKGHFN